MLARSDPCRKMYEWCRELRREAKKKKEAQMNGDDESVPHLQCVVVGNECIGLVVERPKQISQPEARD